MPIALSKDETCPVWLRSDADKPEAERPTFLFHYLTRAEVRRVDAWRKEGEGAAEVEQIEAMLDKIIRLGLAGWRNVRDRDGNEIPYSPDSLDDVLTLQEKMELAVYDPSAVDAGEAKKKNRGSASALTSETAPSAPDAGTGSAPTPPPSGNP
jgi:hypothetical protein